MRTHSVLAASLAVALPVQAQTWNEGNAGQTITTLEATIGNGTLTQIVGSLTSTQSADLYLIKVEDVATFSASTVGGATFDTQLWLFNLQGFGISFNDDSAATLRSTVTGAFLTAPGYVILGVSQFDNDPLDVGGLELWSDLPFGSERAPDGPGAANPFTQWSGLSTGTLNYTIALRGAAFAGPINANAASCAWAWCNVSGAPGTSFTPSVYYQHTPTGELITVDHPATGEFVVNLPPSMDNRGTATVTAYGSNNTAVIEYWDPGAGKMQIHVAVLDTAGALVDGNFCVNYRVGGAPTERAAWLWADQASAAAYTPNTTWSWNGSRPSPTIVRNAVGNYTVTLPGLSNAATAEGGHVQVSAYCGLVPSLMRAKVQGWGPSGADLFINVLTFNAVGAAADQRFTLSYHEKAAPIPKHLGSGAHVWANNATAASYAPSPFWTDSNGTFGPPNSESITRSGPGIYTVYLPNVAPFGSSIAIATAYGTNANYASVSGWYGSGTGTAVDVLTFTSAGVLADSQFDLNYLTSFPAGTPGTNTVIGGGCSGLVMSGMTRPVLGTSWNLAIENVPPTTVAALALVGVNNPNLALGFVGAPGCVLYNDLLISPTVPVPVVNPAWSLAIPLNPIFIGNVFYAQGAALVPAINPLQIITSNGVRGFVGDV